MKTPERLLVRGVNWLGDAVMSIPALTRLREALPNTHITLLTAEKLAELWRGHPALDDLISFSRQQGVGYVSQALRDRRFDAALIFPGSFRSAFESWLAGIPRRIGYASSGRSFLLTERVTPRPDHVRMRKKSAAEIKNLITTKPAAPREIFPSSGHHLHQYLRLVSALGASESALAPALPIPAGEVQAFQKKFSIAADLPRIGLNPGAEYGPAKRWPVENFAAAATRVAEAMPVEFVVFGGPSDSRAATELETAVLKSGASVKNLAGRTTLRELAAGLACCDVVLTNDTGPMHLAAAVGTRVIVPFGSTAPELTGPGLPRDPRHQLLLGNVPCAPCFLRVCPIDLRCLKSIAPESVADALARVVRDLRTH